MIYRHSIAPTRAFTQLSNELIRHPRLDSEAYRILTWQLSLPAHAPETLSRTAERTRIKGCAFTRAKKQLRDEGYLHEWRVQGAGGRWTTRQFLSSDPMSREQARAIMNAGQPPSDDATASPQVAPSRQQPAVGQPGGRPTDGHPSHGDNTGETTSNHPGPGLQQRAPEPILHVRMLADSGQPESQAPEPEEPESKVTPASIDAAHALVTGYRLLDPALRGIPRAMTAELTALTARWLDAGHTAADLRTHILRSLPSDGTPVRHPGGLLRYLLADVPPTPERGPVRATRPPVAPDRPRVSARLSALRECEGPHHTQAHLFRAVADEDLCPRCREAADSQACGPELSAVDSWRG
ncbi:hypothetical protein [Streptomyces sp. NPDC050145]|uniref:hypothetical protein n=1 Tax=Streptomyces sp. NPDC050145 TaxID=3365602 RepID=UPI0037A6A379